MNINDLLLPSIDIEEIKNKIDYNTFKVHTK